jgi:hypothetical protein
MADKIILTPAGEFMPPEVFDALPPGTVLESDQGVRVVKVKPTNRYLDNSVCVLATGEVMHYSNFLGLSSGGVTP